MTADPRPPVLALPVAAKSQSKYHNEPVVVDGVRFDSKREAARYVELRMLQGAGEISELRCQYRYRFVVSNVHVADYIADFVYLMRDGDHWKLVVEDVKGGRGGKDRGTRTAVYEIKRKLMRACYGIDVMEVE